MISTQPIPERANVTPEIFGQEIYPAAQPVVLRGFARDWPAVALARSSSQELIAYLKARDSGAIIDCLYGPPEIGGRFFYNTGMTGLNFTRRSCSLTQALELLVRNPDAAVHVQATPTAGLLPGFSDENHLALFSAAIPARIWIGNAVIVQTHFDLSQNIACVVAGRRRFTLFPPDQLPNLYMGPIERTLAGTPVSLVCLEDVDENAFPKFKEAARHALSSELGPGDAIFIPYLWWHHVRSLDPINVLVNYWWNEYDSLGSPMDVLLHAILTLRDLPPAMKDAWKAMFDEFVFSQPPSGAGHLPPHIRGGLGQLDQRARTELWNALAQGVNGHVARNHTFRFQTQATLPAGKPDH
jgi:hypothetical protein